MMDLTLKHVEQAEQIFSYTFRSPEQQAAFRTLARIDVQAAPGSGKTSLLAAKLALMIKEWETPYRGICLLAHTNTAIAEVTRHTRKAGAVLVPPHFIGTVQSFAHRFLALPYLLGEGIVKPLVDDDAFSRRIAQIARWGKFSTLRAWLERRNGLESLAEICFCGPDLRIQMPFSLSDTSPSYAQACAIKMQLYQDGVFRFEDMYAFALAYLKKFPNYRRMLSRRFPFVFVDEAQDLDMRQVQLLDAAFDDGVVMQRFGDSNQAIFLGGRSDPERLGRAFPEENAMSLPLTHRFGGTIARVANRLKCHGRDIQGADVSSVRPHVIVFDAASVGKVLPCFAELILKFNSEGVRPGYVAKAVGARRNGQELKADKIPRDIYDYCAPFASLAREGGVRDEACLCLGFQRAFAIARAETLGEGVRCALRALRVFLEVLGQVRAVKAGVVTKCSRALESQIGSNGSSLERTVARILCRRQFPDAVQWPDTVSLIFLTLLSESDLDAVGPLVRAATYSVWRGDKVEALAYVHCHDLKIEVDTIHNVKGETHDATLLLETYILQAHDLKRVLGNLGELGDERMMQRRKRVFVALTRPRQLACLALPEAHLSKRSRQSLQDELGFVIVDLE